MKTGVLLINIGTPDAPTSQAVRSYLKEFLSDPRVIAAPQWLWQPILRGGILPFRSKQSAKLYQSIWTKDGSPLMQLTKELAENLQSFLAGNVSSSLHVAVGMRYGNPSIQSALERLREKQVDRIIILPLYPQYSATTTASAWDAVTDTLQHWRYIPEIRFIQRYATNSLYINAICQSIEQHWKLHGKSHLLFSFHGIPKRYIDLGDPYLTDCQATTALITNQLNLDANDWTLSFQSRLGPTEWLKPYTADTLANMPSLGIKSVQVICPGFAVDCLETLEEIKERGKEQFLHAGGKAFQYIPALNSRAEHVRLLAELIKSPSINLSL